jgi:deoxycytidylate deaminase
VKYKYPQIVSVKVSDLKMTPGRVYKIDDPRIEASSKHERGMNLARKAARQSNFPGERMACVLISGGRIISVGKNKAKSGHLKDKNYNKNQAHHSELDAVLSASKDSVRGSVAYIAGFTPNQSKEVPCWSSKPCEGCQAMLRDYGVKWAIFHDRVGNLYRWKVN